MVLKLTDEVIKTICIEVKRGVPFKYASRIAGVSDKTVYQWRKKGESEPEDSTSIYRRFYDEFERAKSLAVAYRVESIRKASEEGQWQASAWWLERVAYEDFGKKSVIDANIKADLEEKNLAKLFDKDKLEKIISDSIKEEIKE